MRLLATMVTRNESGRYLQAVLSHLMGIVDGLSVYDDRSADKTVELATAAGAKMAVRPDGVPSFLEHEGGFRQAAWGWFEQALAPAPGDWCLAIDADEVLVAPAGEVSAALTEAIDVASRVGASSVRIPVPEIFGIQERAGLLVDPQARTDGLWGTIAGTRLFAWRPGGIFGPKAMGCGSEPTYVAVTTASEHTAGLELVHLGYADVADQYEKHHRYSSLADHGHADAHVQSIVAPGRMAPWTGDWPAVWKGTRP